MKIILVLSCFLFTYCAKVNAPIPKESSQLILVLTDSIQSTKGRLVYYDRISSAEWVAKNEAFPIVLGRNGLAWGIGLHQERNYPGFSSKKEGDGRSPAGIFSLSAVFAYEFNPNVKMPFILVDDVTECVDDRNSKYYNQVLKSTDLEKNGIGMDWNSSEKMSEYGVSYEQGIVVNHNVNPIELGKGSCIFIHNWSGSNSTTAGCTALDSNELSGIISWLDEARNPILVQLTEQAYSELKTKWVLPDFPKTLVQN